MGRPGQEGSKRTVTVWADQRRIDLINDPLRADGAVLLNLAGELEEKHFVEVESQGLVAGRRRQRWPIGRGV